MRTTIDFTGGGIDPSDDAMPEPFSVTDDGDVVIEIGDVELRMNCLQFCRFLDALNEFAGPVMEEDVSPSPRAGADRE